MTTHPALRLPADLLGAATSPLSQLIDARWLMAYAAGLGETASVFYDTLAPDGPVPHPLFPVCYEWPALVALREHVIGDELAPFSVHATHELAIARAPRAGQHITTTAQVIAVETRRAGTLVVARLTTIDDDGRTLTTTDYGSVYRGVDTLETGRIAEPLARAPSQVTDVAWTERVAVAAGTAHVYTECARIWNPIHTDAAVARRAGLPAIILHGTATLALAASRALAREVDDPAARIRGVRARFTGFVRLPSTFMVRGRGTGASTIAFDAVAEDGASVLGEGVLQL